MKSESYFAAEKPLEKDAFRFQPIGYLESCFKEKFGIPRQAGLVNEARGVIQLKNDPDLKIALRSLEGFSHLWLIFVFHQHLGGNWRPSIRPPRLGGARRVGVFASRSPHRPNPIGISAVQLEEINWDDNRGPRIHVQGIDLLDGTPILDIKPYLPYADSIPSARSGWADEGITRVPVLFTEKAEAAIQHQARNSSYSNLKVLIRDMLSLDPRPAFQKRQLSTEGTPTQESQQLNQYGMSLSNQYGFRLFDFDIKFEARGEVFIVLDVVPFVGR